MASLYVRWNAKVERTPTCWLWRGAVKDTGYGVLQRGRRGEGLIRAHVFAYEHFVGSIPDGHEIRHRCHNRICVNPAHLTTGTRKDNMRDMVEAGRRVWHGLGGSRNGSAKLTDEQVHAIRSDRRILREIAADYGVSIGCISAIRTGRRWPSLTRQPV